MPQKPALIEARAIDSYLEPMARFLFGGLKMAKRRKVITAGHLVREIIYTVPQPRDSTKARAEKSKITSEAQHKLNIKTAKRKLEMRIAANFDAGDLFVCLTFDDLHLPARREAAYTSIRRFLRLLRKARKDRGDELRYIYILEDKHGEGRPHFHIFINSTGEHDTEDIRSLWSYGNDVDIKYIERDKYFALAEYATKERKPVGARSWVCSLNLKEPKIETSYVPDSETLTVPVNAYVLESPEVYQNMWGSFQYAAYWLPLNETKQRRLNHPKRRK